MPNVLILLYSFNLITLTVTIKVTKQASLQHVTKLHQNEYYFFKVINITT